MPRLPLSYFVAIKICAVASLVENFRAPRKLVKYAMFHRYLNLLPNPLNEGLDAINLESVARVAANKNLNKTYIEYPIATPASVLSQGILSQFEVLGLTPSFVVVWANSMENRPVRSAMIHTDLTWYKDAWHGVPCGVNWELTEGTAEFHWLANRDQEAIYPPESGLKLFNAIHYGSRSLRGGYDNFDFVGSAPIIGPTLVRTDVPHAIEFTRARGEKRINISVRFPMEQIGSWDEAVARFSTVIKQE